VRKSSRVILRVNLKLCSLDNVPGSLYLLILSQFPAALYDFLSIQPNLF
jgi:hypothetical protein